jgi:branched-subunit amino acid ABC-type transport system permease component
MNGLTVAARPNDQFRATSWVDDLLYWGVGLGMALLAVQGFLYGGNPTQARPEDGYIYGVKFFGVVYLSGLQIIGFAATSILLIGCAIALFARRYEIFGASKGLPS